MVDDGSAHRNQAHNVSLRYFGILTVHSARRFLESALDKACLSGTSFDYGSHLRYARVRSSAQDDDLETSEVEVGNCITSQRR